MEAHKIKNSIVICFGTIRIDLGEASFHNGTASYIKEKDADIELDKIIYQYIKTIQWPF